MATHKTKRYASRRLVNLLANEELYDRFLRFIRAGASAHAASRTIGISEYTFYRWLRWGEKNRGPEYRRFYRDVMEARAMAQVVAEVKVFKTDPKFWLTHGPARDDWTPAPQEVRLEGFLETTPCPAQPTDLAQAYGVLAELGIAVQQEQVQFSPEKEGGQPRTAPALKLVLGDGKAENG